MSTFFDMDGGGETVTIEKTDNGDFIFHGWDEETELAAIELGFEPSACWIVWNAINDDALDEELLDYASNENVSVVEALIFAGASVKAVDADGWTPLHHAVHKGHTGVVKALLKARASADARNRYGYAPLHLAASSNNVDVTNILLSAGALVNSYHFTPLHTAALNGHVDVVTTLLKAGANVHAYTVDDKTPLRLAEQRGHALVVKVLKDWKGSAEHEQILRARLRR